MHAGPLGQELRRPPYAAPLFPLDPPSQQRHVAAVAAPHHVEHVTGDWYRADYAVERDIAQHAQNDVAGRAEHASFLDDVEGKERRHHVANTGDEADQRIEPEADVGAGDQYSGVEQRRERVHPRDALGAPLRSIQKDIIGACV